MLILVNGLYVAAEFAAVSVRHGQIRALAREGHALARRLLPTLEDGRRLDDYIAACQIGITLSSLVLGAFGQATVAIALGDALIGAGLDPVGARSTAAVAVLVALTALQVVVGELVPKSLALQFPVPAALLTYLPTRWSAVVYRPFIAVLNGSGWAVLRALGLQPGGGHRHVHSPEEIDLLIAESSDGGLLEADEQDRLRRALRLGRTTARQLMTPRRAVVGVDAADPEAAVEAAAASPFTRLPAYRGDLDHPVGVLHTKDVAVHLAAGRPGLPPLRPLLSVPGGLAADQLLARFRERRVRLAAVVDEYGGTEGIVTLEDVLSALVGGVGDEFKEGRPAAEPLPDGRTRLPGALRADEAAELLGPSVGAAATVGGLVVAALGRVPAAGERLRLGDAEVEVERVDGHAVASVLVTPAPAGPDPDA
ncbi:hemolysin family protein [Rubrivirga marina]|uniref:hemolysin family protein n=1 Tax=Rubrivirga marina TaxID=1196024 RepID=UPI001C52B3DC|nr:hemolysin family protein [Rubrivirga marina]